MGMALKDTTNKIKNLLSEITSDLEKAERGNKAAAQRVRTGTICLEKTAKLYRKESIAVEKKGGLKKVTKTKAGEKKAASVKKAAVKKARPAARKSSPAVKKASKIVKKPAKKAASKRR